MLPGAGAHHLSKSLFLETVPGIKMHRLIVTSVDVGLGQP